MAVEIPKQSFTGTIREIAVGGEKGFKVGGETAYPFHLFEGEMPNPPRIGFEVTDVFPAEWADELKKAIGEDVMKDPAAWAKKAVDEYKADLIHLFLLGTDPNGENRGVDETIEVVKKVAGAVDVPLTLWGCGNPEKDTEILKAAAEALADRDLAIGPIVEDNHKQLGAAVIGFKHTAIASTPIDINLAKQLNILLGNLGVAENRILVDPTVGGLGYGLEYCYSVMERARMAALAQEDDKLQYPLYCNLGIEVWKVKEAKASADEMPELGDPASRGVLMEAITAVTMLMAGGDVLIVRHPKTAELIRAFLGEMTG
ncbi:MAG: acetyl-CoA decarbonylase/synthase complex subunit delta [Deltaproteobacteria bacterium]|nr:acetyl-CoA decarbonylase/synthase complex subunit delta [Deltaproteobacteria bacterium]